MAKVNWANSDEDIEANLQWIEDRHAVAGTAYGSCTNPLCRRPWHGIEIAQVGENALGGYPKCSGSHMFDSSGNRLSDI